MRKQIKSTLSFSPSPLIGPIAPHPTSSSPLITKAPSPLTPCQHYPPIFSLCHREKDEEGERRRKQAIIPSTAGFEELEMDKKGKRGKAREKENEKEKEMERESV